MEFGIWSVLPPVLAIILAFKTRNAIISLIGAALAGFLITSDFNLAVTGSAFIMGLIDSFSQKYLVVIVIVMSLAYGIGKLIDESGAANGLIEFLTEKNKIITSRRGSQMMTWLLGVIIFMNSVMSIVITVLTTRNINDKFRVSREKQAMIVKAVGPPMCGILPIGQWGGVLSGLLIANGITDTSIMFRMIPFNFYCLLSVISMAVLILLDKDFFDIKKAEERARTTGMLNPPSYKSPDSDTVKQEVENMKQKKASPAFIFVPSASLIFFTFGYMIYTGKGNLLNGSALDSVLFSSIITSFILLVMVIVSKNMKPSEAYSNFVGGMGNSMELLIIMVMAVTFGGIVSKLGTGMYLANLFKNIISPQILPALVFVITGIIGYATGSCGGTAACMFPIAIPWASAYGADMVLVCAAAWGGSFFGDHISPISDTTYLTAGLVGCDTYAHQRTLGQYGIVWAGLTVIFYLIAGFVS